MEPKCATCGKKINPKELFIKLVLASVWGGETGPGLILCAHCAADKLGINMELLANA